MTYLFPHVSSCFLIVLQHAYFQSSKNDELCLEVLNLANAKAALMRELEMALQNGYTHGDPDQEIDRVRSMVARLSVRQVRNNMNKGLDHLVHVVAALKANLAVFYLQTNDLVAVLKANLDVLYMQAYDLVAVSKAKLDMLFL